jgi:hypothetical protein
MIILGEALRPEHSLSGRTISTLPNLWKASNLVDAATHILLSVWKLGCQTWHYMLLVQQQTLSGLGDSTPPSVLQVDGV